LFLSESGWYVCFFDVDDGCICNGCWWWLVVALGWFVCNGCWDDGVAAVVLIFWFEDFGFVAG
jgi:hypothetical protein